MIPDNAKRLRMFAGPNGSGKTSLVHKLARDFSADGLFRLHHFLNADDLYGDLQEGRGISLELLGRTVTVEQLRTALLGGGRLRPDHPFLEAAEISQARLRAPASLCDNYVAAALTDFLRDELLAAAQSFSFETVMSHRSKVDFFARARAADYRTYLYFIATESSHLNVYRVKTRAALGGHDVPQDKIMQRYKRCLELVGEALRQAYRAFVFDNSGANRSGWLTWRRMELFNSRWRRMRYPYGSGRGSPRTIRGSYHKRSSICSARIRRSISASSWRRRRGRWRRNWTCNVARYLPLSLDYQGILLYLGELLGM